MNYKIAIALCALPFAGCVKLPSEMTFTEKQELIEDLRGRCRTQGIKDDNPLFNECVNHEIKRNVTARYQVRQGIDQVSDGLIVALA